MQGPLRERPQCRKIINEYLSKGISLEDMARGRFKFEGTPDEMLKGLKIQAKIMFFESQNDRRPKNWKKNPKSTDSDIPETPDP